MNFQPLANRITLRAATPPEKVGSIFLPPSAQQDYTLCQAEIVAVGAGVCDSRLQPGLRVVTKRFGAVAHDDDRSLFTVWEQDVLAIVDLGTLSATA